MKLKNSSLFQICFDQQFSRYLRFSLSGNFVRTLYLHKKFVIDDGPDFVVVDNRIIFCDLIRFLIIFLWFDWISNSFLSM